MKTADEQLNLLVQGCETVVTRDELKKKLEQGRPLRAKLGCDPTAPDLHLGHSIVLRKLREFQDLGHKAVLIIGDYTALIGDPTGQNKTRPMLRDADIERNAKTYFEQAGKILDTAPDKLEIRRNSEWLAKMSFADVIRLASKMTVARMLERDTFEKRHKAGEPISVHEFLYPLMQGYDSVMIQADVELGGTDQTFNNLVGRDLQRDAGQGPQIVMILPILEGLDGVEKMSKSKGNYIGISDTPKDMFGKTMSISDDLMWKWYGLLFFKSPAEIAVLKSGHPMEAKKALAHAIVARYHGAVAADQAREDFEKQFSKKDLADVAESLSVPAGEIWIVELVEKTGKFRSRGDIRRVIQQGGVTLDGQKVTDDRARVAVRDGQILKAGKLVVVRLTVS
ncbi:MAG TPA: tyrosine--tRNA ligase [Verrucomicrobiae bacterium]|nr:tyrosine--tRNA ligase [Verrucomicrobiae bacterium]